MTARKVNQVVWEEWRRRVKRQRESGLSIAEFCRREKVSPHSFHVWKRKLGQPESAGRTSKSAAAAKRSGNRRAAVTPCQGPRPPVAGPAVPGGSPAFLELPVTSRDKQGGFRPLFHRSRFFDGPGCRGGGRNSTNSTNLGHCSVPFFRTAGSRVIPTPVNRVERSSPPDSFSRPQPHIACEPHRFPETRR